MTFLFPKPLKAFRDPSREIIVVGFAGGGGSCEGIKQALGRSPDEALVAANVPEMALIREAAE